jgi:Mg2+-importing ATPase
MPMRVPSGRPVPRSPPAYTASTEPDREANGVAQAEPAPAAATRASPPPPAEPAAGLTSAQAAGLTSAEAAERLRHDGPNAIGGSGRRTRLAILVAQVASPLVLILVAASLVSLVVGDDVTAIIILSIVAMSATLGFVQEARSESAVAALQARLTLHATVMRDGTRQEIPIHDVVRDDLVLLGAGDIVPADIRIIEADHLYIDEASLTGESAPSPKSPRAPTAGTPTAGTPSAGTPSAGTPSAGTQTAGTASAGTPGRTTGTASASSGRASSAAPASAIVDRDRRPDQLRRDRPPPRRAGP